MRMVSMKTGERIDGMTLRDWFAGNIVNGILAGIILDNGLHAPIIGEPEVLASKAYAIADAMLAHRKDTPNAD